MKPRHKKPWKQPVAVTAGVTSVLRKMELNGKLLELKVREAWRDAVGESIARRSAPSELERGTLHLTVESPTWMNELHFIEKEILERVNAKYRELTPGATDTPVKRIKMHRGVLPPLPPRPVKKESKPVATLEEIRGVEERLREVQDPDLRDAARKMLLKTVVADREPR